jgi:excisionase family DNA binding protein
MAARYLTPAEVADELRISPDTVYRLIAAGELAAIRVSPRILRIPIPAFETYRAARKPSPRRVVRRRVSTEPRLGEAVANHDLQPA